MEKIKADYGDEIRYYSMQELRERFKEETEEWRRQFFESLDKKGVAYTQFAKYSKH